MLSLGIVVAFFCHFTGSSNSGNAFSYDRYFPSYIVKLSGGITHQGVVLTFFLSSSGILSC